jgi:hypothetical protein
VTHAARIADGVQRQLGDLLLQLLRDVKARVGGDNLCLGGGFFFATNSCWRSRVSTNGRSCQPIPATPGRQSERRWSPRGIIIWEDRLGRVAHLGRSIQIDEIKTTLDNCKLSYDYHHDGQVIERTAAASQGPARRWFQGGWNGGRALGNRSILASPVAPYVLDNLNLFLKRREPHRPSAFRSARKTLRVSSGGPADRGSWNEYEVIEPDILRPCCRSTPPGFASRLSWNRPACFTSCSRRRGPHRGANAREHVVQRFNEPIVCTPRDAVRVFGTGLDLVVLGSSCSGSDGHLGDRRSSKLVLAAIAVLVASGVCELAARALLPAPPDETRQPRIVYRYDPEIRYVLSPSQQGWIDDGWLTINSLGFRGREVVTPKPPGSFRVVVIGDSVTMGWGVGDNETSRPSSRNCCRRFPGRSVDVVNLGVGGYDTRQEVALLKRNVSRLQPDLVLVGFYSNDVPDALDDNQAAAPSGTRIAASHPEAGQSLHMDSNAQLFTDADSQAFILPGTAPHYAVSQFVECTAASSSPPNNGC